MTQRRDLPFRTAVCCCGCGSVFEVSVGQHQRVWAPDCPSRERHEMDLRNAAARRREAIAKLTSPPRTKAGGKPPSDHVSSKKCHQCCALPHRRPTDRRCACGGYFAELPPVKETRSA